MTELTQKDLETALDKRFDKMAVMIKNGFDNTATKKELEEVRMDLKTDIASLQADVVKIDDGLKVVETKLDKALYTEIVKLETRVKKIEEHLGMKPSPNLELDFSR